MIDRTRRVVLLIDYDNLQICASRDTPGRDLQLTPVVQLAQRYGSVILARAYAEWNLSTERLAVYKSGIEPAFAPVLRTESDRSGKSLADTVMVAEGMDMLWTLSPDVVVLATSDKDLIPLVRVAKQRGAFVVVLGSDFTAIPLREMADEHITYRQLITEATGRSATEAGPGRQPAALPEPPRRRRDRTGRERAATPAPTTPAQPAAPVAPTAEPVAPVTVSTPGDADAQSSGRRRRRRGSRRRADRLTATTGESSAVETSQTEVPEPGVESSTEETEVTPTFSAETLEVEAAEPTAPAPRERRRRTRRTTPAAETTPPADQVVVPEQSAEIPPAPPPEATSANGATAADAETPAPPTTRRPRRVASASRGRSRPV
jgi:uncharacterized LabA/DUF88 family protein